MKLVGISLFHKRFLPTALAASRQLVLSWPGSLETKTYSNIKATKQSNLFKCGLSLMRGMGLFLSLLNVTLVSLSIDLVRSRWAGACIFTDWSILVHLAFCERKAVVLSLALCLSGLGLLKTSGTTFSYTDLTSSKWHISYPCHHLCHCTDAKTIYILKTQSHPSDHFQTRHFHYHCSCFCYC